LRRVICISHLPDFEVHHMSNVYVDRVGLNQDGMNRQIEALLQVVDGARSADELMVTEKPLRTSMWDKDYYEPCSKEIEQLLPDSAKEVLSVGCGWGALEASIAGTGRRVTAIPLDNVISTLAEDRGIRVLSSDLEAALHQVQTERFDAVLVSNVLQHLRDPVAMLQELKRVLNSGGAIVGIVPNLSILRRLSGRILGRNRKFSGIGGAFDKTRLHLTSTTTLTRWLRSAGFEVTNVRYEHNVSAGRLSAFGRYVPRAAFTRSVIFRAE
jgi:2-polyprenyl-3-methyl-5-hydroxy-6-metoxy-1,4-benzoquinol methylase